MLRACAYGRCLGSALWHLRKMRRCLGRVNFSTGAPSSRPQRCAGHVLSMYRSHLVRQPHLQAARLQLTTHALEIS